MRHEKLFSTKVSIGLEGQHTYPDNAFDRRTFLNEKLLRTKQILL